jgi:hypothetical protein
MYTSVVKLVPVWNELTDQKCVILRNIVLFMQLMTISSATHSESIDLSAKKLIKMGRSYQVLYRLVELGVAQRLFGRTVKENIEHRSWTAPINGSKASKLPHNS